MTQYNTLNTKLSNSQLNKLKSVIKIETEVVWRLSPNMIGDSNDKTNFPHELLLTDRQVSSIRQAFANNSSADIEFSKIQLSKMIESGRSWSITQNRITTNRKGNYTISKKCISSFRINSSSISSRCRDT